MNFKHYDSGNGYEYCSGRVGWPRRKTTLPALVTCKNCLKALARIEPPKDPLVVCRMCGGTHRADRSCDCFDNGCQ